MLFNRVNGKSQLSVQILNKEIKGEKMKKRLILAVIVSTSLFLGCQMELTDKTKPQDFISEHVKTIEPMEKKSNLAYWKAARSGKSEDYDKQSELVLKIRRIYTNTEEFTYLKNIMESDIPMDHLTARQIKILYNGYLTNQIDPMLLEQTVKLASDIEKNFSTFRGTVDGKKLTDNDIRAILKDETDSEKRKKAWLASKQVAPIVADDIIKLVKLRNKGAKQVGYDSFHTLNLESTELEVAVVDKLFEKLDKLTRKPYAKVKAKIDSKLASNCNIKKSEIMPWHYHDPFFQEAPMTQKIDLAIYYKGKDIEALSAEFFNALDLNVDSILKNSDLYERQGKNPHAFCTDIDKKGDARILCNIKDSEAWMKIQLHELGHAVYSRYHDRNVPYLLRNPAHSFTTEAIAMIFGRLSENALWMQDMLDLTDAQRIEIKEATGERMKIGQLIFARWALVMYNFEKQLYANPDQDLNDLWWDMVEKYQFVKRPEGRDAPDWAAKIHFTIAPCYYHSYLLGEMLASQLQHYMLRTIPGVKTDKGINYVGQKQIGTYLQKKVFEPGNVYHFNEMIKKATGENLTPKYFVEDFVN